MAATVNNFYTAFDKEGKIVGLIMEDTEKGHLVSELVSGWLESGYSLRTLEEVNVRKYLRLTFLAGKEKALSDPEPETDPVQQENCQNEQHSDKLQPQHSGQAHQEHNQGHQEQQERHEYQPW